MTEIERITEELGKAIHDSEEYLAYEAARRNYDESERLQALTGEFNLKKNGSSSRDAEAGRRA